MSGWLGQLKCWYIRNKIKTFDLKSKTMKIFQIHSVNEPIAQEDLKHSTLMSTLLKQKNKKNLSTPQKGAESNINKMTKI